MDADCSYLVHRTVCNDISLLGIGCAHTPWFIFDRHTEDVRRGTTKSMSLRIPRILVVLSLVILNACGNDSPTEPVPPEPPAPVPTRIAVTPALVTLDAIGQTAELSAQVLDQYNAPMAGAIVSWISGNAAVATVSASGQVKAVGNGSTLIAAQSGSASATVNVKVMQSAQSIAIDPQTATLTAIGETVQLTATVLDGNEQPVAGVAVSWTSSDMGVATVDDEGLVTAVGNGSTEITARSGGASASANVTVMQAAASIVIEPRMATLMAAGETVQLTATVLDRNEQPVAGVAIAWTSSNAGVATVDEEGLVTAVGSGDARITASHGDLTDSAQINVNIANPDRATLITLYNALGGPNWLRSTNWLSDLPLDTWQGVETDDDGRVTKLDLGFNNLTGDIPVELGNLTKLQELYLYENDLLSCRIPPELGNLTNLRRLSMFTIPIVLAIFPPVWDPIPNPECTIPPEMGNLTSLQELHLGLIELSGGIPPEFGNLANLQVLDLGYNALTGGIPSELGKLTNLRSLSLGYNKLSDSIPPELGNLTNLQELHLDLNELSGSIPSELGDLSRLQKLVLEFNGLSGSVPPELGNLSELTHLSLVYNEDLSGPLPDTFTSLENIQLLNLYLTGLCVPPDAAFRAWLEGIPGDPGVPFCGEM